MDKEKKCAICKEVKPISEFNIKRNESDGLNYYCRKCQGKYQRERRKANKNKDSFYHKLLAKRDQQAR